MTARSVPESQTNRLRLEEADLDWFGSVGHDKNPLHLDTEHARRSPFGGRIAHGVLGALSAASFLPEQPRLAKLRRLVFEFPRPFFTGIEHTVDVQRTDDDALKYSLRVADGALLVARGMASFEPGTEWVATSISTSTRPSASTLEWPLRARTWGDEDLIAGLSLSLPFDVSGRDYAMLEERFRLRARGVSEANLIALIATSYVIGMHLPGERALFSRMQLDFPSNDIEHITGAVSLECKVKSFDRRLGLLRIVLEVQHRHHETTRVIARGDLQSFVRRVSGVASSNLDGPRVASKDLDGKVALVVGGSRGLGAALVRSFASRGAHVLASYRSSESEAQSLREQAFQLGGHVTLIRGDGGDSSWCKTARSVIEAEHGGRLDFLCCNASPPLRPLWLDPASSERLFDHINSHVRLVGAPLAFFLDHLAKTSGIAVLSSSSAVETVVAEWPHYVAAKAAAEALFRVGARERPGVRFVIARPPQLLTDFAPILGAAPTALSPAVVAEAIVNRLMSVNEPLTVLDRFA